MTFALGSDPEVVLTDRSGKFISAIGLIGGSKESPKRTPHGFVQEDNVLVEFNTSPARSSMQFVQNTQDMLDDIYSIIKPLDLSVNILSSALFNEDQLMHYRARLAGCEPDFNAWTGEENIKPDLESTAIRTCGGHLHISFDEAKEDFGGIKRYELVQALDLVAGVPSVLMDKDADRRGLYGRAGACRPKYTYKDDEYDGIEYRVLSNFWLTSANHMSWAYSAVETVLKEFDKWVDAANTDSASIIEAINTSNQKLAQKLIKKYSLGGVYAQ